MKFLDLTKQYQSIKEEIDTAIKRVLDKGVFINGKEVSLFEEEMADFCQAKFAIGVNSGTDALYLSLKALDIGSEDEVITTPFTFIATAEAIANCGAKPVFVDIDSSLNIDSSQIKINEKTKAIMPVHLFGRQAKIDAKVNVIEDSAQAIGLPLSGTLACFSFFPSKNLGGYGDGGMVVTNNQELADKIRLLKNHGSSPDNKYLNLVLGTNSRLDTIQAAILRVKLQYISKWNVQRKEAAQYYSNQLKDIVKVPDNNNIFHQYTIRVANRDKLKDYLRASDIPTMIYYPIPLHLQPVFKYLGYQQGDFPEAEKASQEVLSLPIYPDITKEDQDDIIKKIKEFYA